MTARASILRAQPLDHAAGDAFVNAWVGVPFKWDGRDRTGVDCWGLAWLWHRDVLGIALPDWVKGEHGLGWVRRTLAAEHAARWRRLAEGEPGCIVLTLPSTRPAHVGIFWRGGVLHAEEGAGVQWNPLALFAMAHPGHEFGRYQPELGDG
jgi:cell wall-associated NlpC family hydrolase